MEEVKKHHMMLDLETLGKTSDSVILSIGAVCFDMDGTIGPEFEVYPKVEPQIPNRKIEWSAICWWMKQEEAARNAIVDPERTLTLSQCLEKLTFFCKSNLDEKFKVWSNGAAFDIATMNHAYDQLRMEKPWSYKHELDTRTMVYMSRISTKNYEATGIKHRAVDDCKWQISWLVDAFKILRGY